jgi:hypothetical protein
MIDTKFIIQIATEKFNKFVDLNLDTLDENFQAPSYNWIQNDPTGEKQSALIQYLTNDTIQLIECKNVLEQRLLIKKIIYNKILKLSHLVFILMVPLPKIFELADLKDPYVQKKIEDYSKTITPGFLLNVNDINNYAIRYYNQSFTRNQLDFFWELISKSENWFQDYGITLEKSLKNVSAITQLYSLNLLSCIILEECALSLGIPNIKESAQQLRINTITEIREFIKNIDSETKKINKFTFKDQLRSLKNIQFEKDFFKDD